MKRSGMSSMRGLAIVLGCGALIAAPQPADLAARSRRAKEAMVAGRFDEAAVLYEELTRALPDNAGMAFNLGLARFSAGRYREAIAAFEASVKLDARLARAWMLLGMGYLKLEQPARAVAPLERAVQLAPSDATARLELADALLSLGRYLEAAGHFRRLSELTPGDPRAWYGLGTAYLELSRAAFRRLEAVAPESAYWYALLARSRAEQQQFGSAYYLYRQALAARADFRGIHAAIADIYRRAGHADWAAIEEACEQALPPPDCERDSLECLFFQSRHREVLEAASRRQDPEAIYWTSRAASELALAAFQRVEALGPSVFRHRLAAETYRLQDRHAEAVREWRAALKLAPHDAALKLELARSLMWNQEHEAAAGLLEELAKTRPGAAEVHLLLGLCLLNLQEPAKALPALETAHRLDPKSLEVRAALGRALLQSDRPAAAIPHLEAATAADDDGNLHYLLAQAYLRTGQRDKAEAALHRQKEVRRSAQARAQEREQKHRITAPVP